jgi:hypothetical protein
MLRFYIVVLALAALICPAQLDQQPRVVGLMPVPPKPVLENEFVSVGVLENPNNQPFSFIARLPTVRISVLDGSEVLSEVTAKYYSAHQHASVSYPKGRPTLREIAIELKSQPPEQPFARDAVKLDPQHNLVLFENSHIRVVRVRFGLGEKGPVVDKRPRVIILLNDMHADVARHEGDPPSARDGKAGVIQWSLGGSQATMNRNETILDNIVVEIKGK